MLMVHTDCGAYGGLQAFGGNEEREAANHESELRIAAAFLKNNIPPIEVECYYLKFNGVWALEPRDLLVPRSHLGIFRGDSDAPLYNSKKIFWLFFYKS